MFTDTNSRSDIKEFVTNRITKFNEHIIKDRGGSIGVILHLIPLSYFNNTNAIDIESIYRKLENGAGDLLNPVGTDFKFTQYPVRIDNILNGDGIERTTSSLPEKQRRLQLFRNSAIEASYLILADCTNREKSINLKRLREKLDLHVAKYFEYIRAEGIDGPIIIFMSILNIHGASICLDDSCGKFSSRANIQGRDLGNIEIINIQNNSLEPFYKILYNIFGETFNHR